MRVVTKVQDRWTLVVRIVKLKLVWPGLENYTATQQIRPYYISKDVSERWPSLNVGIGNCIARYKYKPRGSGQKTS